MSIIRTSTIIGTRVLGGLAAGTLLFLGVASPASAATASGGCTVAPRTPVAVTAPSGALKARYEVTVACAGGRWVEIQQRQLESDFNGNQLTGTASFTSTFAGAGAAVVSATAVRPDTEVFNEEILQSVRFRVHVAGWTSAWTTPEFSAIQVMPN
jgi:hypothetical protein